jgi:hypothetical protein
MPTIGYGYEVIRPDYKPDLVNVDLVAKVLMTKQAQYNDSYAKLSSLQSQALGIRFLNKYEQRKIDNFNNELSKNLSGDLGDLSDSANLSKYYSMFDVLTKDKNLIGRYRQDAKYQEELSAVEAKRMAKDPKKAGFHPINYGNYMARLEDYIGADLDSPQNSGLTVGPYTDYVDYHSEISKLMKSVPIKKFSQSRVENGYLITDHYEGRDPNETKAVVADFMAGPGAMQAREEAEFTFRRAKGDPIFQQTLYSDYTSQISQREKELSDRIDSIDKELTAATNPDKVQALAGEKARLEGSLSETRLAFKSPDDFFARPQDEIVDDLTSVFLQDKIITQSAAHGGYAKTTKVEPDRTFIEMQKLGMRVHEHNDEMQLEYAKLAGKDSDGQTTSMDGKQVAIMSGMSYISGNDPEHIDFGSVYDSAKGSLEKLYSQQVDILKDGITDGNQKWDGERTGLELLLKPNYLDNNPHYGGSPYLRAFKVALDEAAVSRPDLYELVGGKRPETDADWNRLKELNGIVSSRVNQMMNSPKTREEAQYNNHLQDVKANLESMNDFLRQANESGDPVAFVKDHPRIARYGNAVYQFELPKDIDKNTKQAAARTMSQFQASFDTAMNHGFDITGKASNQVSIGTFNKVFESPNRIRQINPDEISQIKVSDNGKVKVFFKDTAFQEYQVTTEDGKITDEKRSGMFFDGERYVTLVENGKVKKVTATDIKAKGYLEYVDPNYNKFNWSNQLGLSASAKPQKRWDVSADGQSVAFEIRKNTVTGNIDLSINGGAFYPTNLSDPDAVIAQARASIAGRNADELQTAPRQ